MENLDTSQMFKRTKSKKDENINEKKLNYLCKYDWFNKVIKTKFLELFKIYYNQKYPLKEIFFQKYLYQKLKILMLFYKSIKYMKKS